LRRLAFALLAATAAVSFLPIPAEASLVTSLPGGTPVAMPTLESFGAGPITFGPGITWISTPPGDQGGSVFGYTGGYGFGSNGFWDENVGPMAGLNDASGTMAFRFNSPVRGVGGFINHFPNEKTLTTITAYRVDGHSESFSFNLDFGFPVQPPDDNNPGTGVGANQGRFLGFSESEPSIIAFTLSGNFVAITDLTVDGVVPEPASGTLIGLGFLGAAWIRRRKPHLPRPPDPE
jgi:PEP-CTERM motif